MSERDHLRDEAHVLFISDLHLSDLDSPVTERFTRFCRSIAGSCESLYILGDLFEFWVGDDTADEPLNRHVCAELARVRATGVRVHFMHGNRDFLAGPGFSAAAEATLLPDPTVIDLHGTRTLLMHGDLLCTDDLAYQAFRRQVRTPEVQRQFLTLSVEARKARVGQTRAESERVKREKSEAIMDVSPEAVTAAMREHRCDLLIHGHTHRPGRHEFEVDGNVRTRWVLSDWTLERADCLCATREAITRIQLA
ncbi:MAG: UDP-2,3-diacylglucosamine diphosphatase [Betaproteobacteria bacterium]|nr:UDP-2,3-diacylglucosamine diphosphatase [Betaproteobacteria bacterium]